MTEETLKKDDLHDTRSRTRLGHILEQAGSRLGILPVLLLGAIILFSLAEPRFLSLGNVTNVIRQSTYLIIVSVGQLVVILTAGMDLTVGSSIAMVSVVTALTMAGTITAVPGAESLAIAAGVGAGLSVGVLIGTINGIGVAVLRVNPFMMTLGMLSIAFGLALTLSGGTPVYGMPSSFRDVLGYSRLLGIPTPIYFAAATVMAIYVLLNWTAAGRYFYALGSNARAAHLSGIRVPLYLLLAYIVCGLCSGLAGVLLTARVLSGEATMGQDLVLQSIAACVVGGVSLSGGIGRVGNAVLGALFITILTNGMNLSRIDAYLQQVVLGVVLIFAIVVAQYRLRRSVSLK